MEKTICTIGELFSWYMGIPEWHEDWQTTNSMICQIGEGEVTHCQDDDEDGMSHLRFLKDHENETIEIESDESDQGDYDLIFSIKDRTYTVQSLNPALSEIED